MEIANNRARSARASYLLLLNVFIYSAYILYRFVELLFFIMDECRITLHINFLISKFYIFMLSRIRLDLKNICFGRFGKFFSLSKISLSKIFNFLATSLTINIQKWKINYEKVSKRSSYFLLFQFFNVREIFQQNDKTRKKWYKQGYYFLLISAIKINDWKSF